MQNPEYNTQQSNLGESSNPHIQKHPKKITQKKKPEITIPKKGEVKKYKYYSDNFKEKDPHAEKMKKENRLKKAKEKAKIIEKKRKKITIKYVEEKKKKKK